MEGQRAKRRRVYSLEPNKAVQAVFTRNYVNYLVPALMKIKEKKIPEPNNNNNNNNNLGDVVKYEVDMAMAFSAQGFQWSNALKSKLLQRNIIENVDSGEEEEEEAGSSRRRTNCHGQIEMLSPPLLLDNLSSSNPIITSKSHHHHQAKVLERDLGGEEKENEDDDVIDGQLRSLSRLVPGGEEMRCNEQMVGEIESYVRCLQMQVNILQYLADHTPN